jgi:hypothetical protein
MHDSAEHKDVSPVVNASIPEWAKFAATIIGTTVIVIGWAEARFVSRVEWSNHQSQQTIDMGELKQTQLSYAIAERGTSSGLNALTVDVAEIKNDVSWLRAYLDVTQPMPKKNKKP